METDLGPHELLGLLQAVEGSLEREHSTRWGPRTVDLDLLLYDQVVIDSERLTLPHPRMATRRFVLEPCAEIAANLTHPTAGCSIGELLANISEPHPYVAVAGVPGSGVREVAAAVADSAFGRLVHCPMPAAPKEGADVDEWLTAVETWSKPLESCCCHDDSAADRCHDHHGTVSDYWLGSLRLAGERLSGTERRGFIAAYREAAGRVPRPQVVLFVATPPEVLAERIVFRGGGAARYSDIFSDIGDDPQARSVEELVALQSLLADELLHRRADSREASLDRPRAVVCIDSSDLGQAVEEAVAAVEAMG